MFLATHITFLKKRVSCNILIFFFWQLSFAQSSLLNIPVNYKDAYEIGTRSMDGYPGDYYWQNKAIYKMGVYVFTEEGRIKGKGEINYINNSPDELEIIVFKNYQDIYQKGSTRNVYVDPGDLHDGLVISKIGINGTNYLNEQVLRKDGSNMFLVLPEELQPNDSVQISINWEFSIPEHYLHRFGKYSDQSFFLAYWYPQIAVYDDVDGWNYFQYEGMQEFYNDFNNYEVKINVPAGYVVWSTGVLQNSSEVFETKFSQRYREVYNSIDPAFIIDSVDIHKSQVTRKKKWNQWYFIANNVTDFSFALSNEYMWKGTSVKSEASSKVEVFVSCVYPPVNKNFDKVLNIAVETMKELNLKSPGVKYPFNEYTIFCGSEGMEFPMMSNQGDKDSREETVFVTSHEITHAYFPFLTGINESKYAWMDEGLTMLLPYEVQMRLDSLTDPLAQSVSIYNSVAGTELDVPLMFPSVLLGANGFTSYQVQAYHKSFVALYVLKKMIGDSLFLNSLRGFIEVWKEKHPSPFDFFNYLNNNTSMDLNWYWHDWFFSSLYPDLAVELKETNSLQKVISIKNTGGLPLPVDLNIKYDDGSVKRIHYKADVWKNDDQIIDVKIESYKNPVTIFLGNNHVPDIYPKDNSLFFE